MRSWKVGCDLSANTSLKLGQVINVLVLGMREVGLACTMCMKEALAPYTWFWVLEHPKAA